MRLRLINAVTYTCFFALTGAVASAQITRKSTLVSPADSTEIEQLRVKSRNIQSLRPDSALIYAQRGLDLSRKIGYAKGEGNCLNRLGVVFWKNGKYDRALLFLLNSLKLREKINDRPGILKSLNDIGIIYSDQGDNAKALTYHFKAKIIAQALRDKKGTSIVLANIGNCYLKLNRVNLALSYELQAYSIQHELNDASILPNTLSILGDIHFKLGNIPLALEYYRLSIPYAVKSNDQGAIADTYNSIAQLYNKINLPDSSLHYASGALKAAQTASYAEGVFTASTLLAGYYQAKNEHLELIYYKKAMAAKDSMFNAEKIKEIQNLSFNEAARQQEITDEKNRIADERIINLQLIGIALFIPFFFLSLLMLSKSRIHRKVIEFMSVLSLLMCFEFITLLIHPFVQQISNHLPVIELVILILLAAILVPVHHALTHWLREKLAHTHHPVKDVKTSAVKNIEVVKS